MKKQISCAGSPHLSLTVSRLLLLLAICLIPVAHASGSNVLYDQLNNQHSTGTDSDDFSDLPAWTSFTADDFVVPAHQTWRITGVDVRGAFAGSGPVETFNVVFYQDIGGLPGTAVHIATAQEYGGNDGFYRITLRIPAILGSGTYWISVQARLGSNANGTWTWTNRTVQSNSPAVWQNPNGGSGRCATWAARSTCVAPGNPDAPDQAFRLMGTDTFVVTNVSDAGPGSLRQALADASDGDAIRFDPALNGQTITLTSGQLSVNENVTVSGPGAGQLSVNGNAAGRVFHISAGKTVTISGLTITNGSAPSSWGGGIDNDHATLTLSNCTISGNAADQGIGGGIYNNGSGGSATLTIISCTISGNSAWPGGGIFNDQGTVTITNSTLSGNSDNGYNFGGAIVNIGTLTIADSTLSGNSAYSGGAIYNWSGAMLTVSSTTFSGNFCSTGFNAHGGGILNEGGTANIGNTIFKAGPSGENIYNVQQLGPVTSLGYNLSSDDGGGHLTGTGDQINTDPKLGPLQNNGGPTFTHLPASDSRAIDGSDPAMSMDQRGLGFARVVNGRADIGAVEVQATATPTPTSTPNPGATSTPAATVTPGLTPIATPTATATPTVMPMATATATATPPATATATATPIAIVSPTSSPTASTTPTPGAHLANISTRLRVEAGDNVLIAGFVIQGTGNKRLIIRGIAPSLSAFGVGDVLRDPTLQLFSGNTEVDANDNWPDNPQADEIAATGLAPTNSNESALLVSVAPGSYTAVLRGKGGFNGCRAGGSL
jgi:hypothetical protein